MRAGVVLVGLGFLLAIGYYAIDLAQGWKGPGAPPAVDAPATLAPALDDPHAPPRLEYWPPPAATGALPRLVVEPAELDFGRVPVQGQRERRVLIANEGTGPLEISQGATTCEATLSDRPGETLAPGERRALVVRWSPSSATDGEDQFLEIRSNDPAHPKFKLKLKGRAAVPLAIVPNSIWELPAVEGQTRVERTGWLVSNLVPALEVADLEFDRDLLEINTRPAPSQRLTEMEALSGVELVIALKPGKVYGLMRIPVRVRVRVPADAEGRTQAPAGDAATTPAEPASSPDQLVPSQPAVPIPADQGNPRPAATDEANEDPSGGVEDELHPDFPEVVLLVTVLRKGPLLLVGPGYDAKQGIAGFGAFSASDGAELTIAIRARNAPADGLQILGCESDPPGLTATLTPDGPVKDELSRYKLRLIYPPGSPATQRLVTNPGFVRLKLNHPEVAELLLPVHLHAH
jgi:hypothetical protein